MKRGEGGLTGGSGSTSREGTALVPGSRPSITSGGDHNQHDRHRPGLGSNAVEKGGCSPDPRRFY